MYRVKIASREQFEAFREEWNHLALAMKRPSFFCSWEWIHTWWRHFGKQYDLRILLILEGEKLAGILPLARSKFRPGMTMFPARILMLCGSRELYPDHMDFIGGEDGGIAALTAGFDFLMRTQCDWDLIHLSHIGEDSLIMKYFENNPGQVKKASVSPFIALNGGFDEFLKRFSRKHRYNLNRQQKKLYTEQEVIFSYGKAGSENGIVKDLTELFRLHKMRKDNVGIKSTFAAEKIAKFHIDLAKEIAPKGWLRMSSLKKGNQIIAMNYGFTFGGSFNFYQSGLDPDWESQSVGATLLMETIREAMAEGCKEFDFLRGDEEYKRLWTKEGRILFDVLIPNKNLSGRILKSEMAAKNWVRRILGKDSPDRETVTGGNGKNTSCVRECPSRPMIG